MVADDFGVVVGVGGDRARGQHLVEVDAAADGVEGSAFLQLVGQGDRFGEALDEGWLKDDERFASPFPRARNKDALVGELDRIFRKRPMAEWLEPLAAAGVPHAPVLDYAGMSEHPQYWMNEYLVEIETPHLGRLRVPGAPVRMSATPPRVDSAGPILGADTEDILLAAGYDWDEIAAFKECGATRTA